MSPAEMLDYIKARCDEVGDCWIWRGGCTSGGIPNMRRPDDRRKSAVSVRSIVLESKGQEKPTPKHWASNTCNDLACVCPAHSKWRTRSDKLKELGEAGKWSGIDLTIAKAKRSQQDSPLDWDKVRDIRSRPQPVSLDALAAEFGVDKTTISKVLRHVTWIERQGNPFAGLFTGLAANDQARKRA